MVRRSIAALAAVGLFVLLVPQSALAVKPRLGCAPGFDLGGLTVEQVLLLPNVTAGLAAGVYTEQDVRDFQIGADKNGDTILCFQSFPTNASPASLLQFFYNTVDNNASVPPP
ncbi:MAG TPA: hypothetical protein VFY54_00590 [Rubrobacter sp.]|nr:hypothetical protein [Rubrobacter sp.]